MKTFYFPTIKTVYLCFCGSVTSDIVGGFSLEEAQFRFGRRIQSDLDHFWWFSKKREETAKEEEILGFSCKERLIIKTVR